MRRKYKRRWGRAGGLFAVLLVVAIGISIAIAMSRVSVFEVPEGSKALLVKPGLIWGYSLKLLGPGSHPIAQFREGTSAYLIPHGPTQVQFQARVLTGFGVVKDLVGMANPYEVKGEVSVNLQDEQVLAIAEEVGFPKNSLDIHRFIFEAAAKSVDGKVKYVKDLDRYGSEAQHDLNDRLAKVKITDARLLVTGVRQVSEKEQGEVATKMSSPSMRMTPVTEARRFVMKVFLETLLIALLVCLLIFVPLMVTPLGSCVGLLDLADIGDIDLDIDIDL